MEFRVDIFDLLPHIISGNRNNLSKSQKYTNKHLILTPPLVEINQVSFGVFFREIDGEPIGSVALIFQI